MNQEKSKTPLEWKTMFDSAQFDEKYYYSENDLGAMYALGHTVFKVWAPTADRIVLNLYKSGMREGLIERVEMLPSNEAMGVWAVSIEGDQNGIYYTYSIEVNGETHETQDVYSKACGVNGQTSMVVDLQATNPSGWEQDQYLYDSKKQPIIYEVHVKDFSSNKHSGIPEEFRGKYKAFTITDSTLDGLGEKPTCLAYLKELGVTHVHLLPCFDFGSIDESKSSKNQFNWGYDPMNYNVPEGSYATDAFDGYKRIQEFKEMVMALHSAGIGVIMDVVYNHTYSTDSCFQKTVPYYYYRLDENGEFANGSICGNDTASERAMYRKFMIDSVCYWAKEYHIDGFRFDLMGLHDVKTMNEIRAALDQLPNGENILMYGEPWYGAESPMSGRAIPAIKKNVDMLHPRISIFCDDTRDSIKGSVFFEKEGGFVNGTVGLEEKIEDSVLAWCVGNENYKPHNPGQIISYVSAHDNYTLWDKLNYTLKEEPQFAKKDDEILQVNKMAAGIYMTCLGSTFFQAGEEFGRTKQGIGDSYKSPSEINELDWKQAYLFNDLVDYYKGLIKLRKEFAGFSDKSNSSLSKIKFQESKQGIVCYQFESIDESDRWNRLFVIYNANDLQSIIQIPDGHWKLISDGSSVFENPVEIIHLGHIDVNSKSVTILGEEKN